jgi:hypothetical protein
MAFTFTPQEWHYDYFTFCQVRSRLPICERMYGSSATGRKSASDCAVRRSANPGPTTGPSNPVPDPVYDEPQTPTRRPSPRSNRLNLRVPPGHLPDAGECRVWVDGLPPGQQARARSCSGILATAPPGSWILYRPAQYHRQVRVRYLHDTRRMVIAVRAFDTETGAYLRDYALEEDDNNMGPVAINTRRPTIRPGGDRTGNRGNGTRERPTVADNQGNRGRGNSDNAPGRIRTASDTSATPDNNGGGAGRGNGTREIPTVADNQGNRGGGNSDNAPGRIRTASDTSATPGNNAGTVGRGNGTGLRITKATEPEETVTTLRAG